MTDYPGSLDTDAKRALYDSLDRDEQLALAVDKAVLRASVPPGSATP
ncbi:hypothetical protein I551_8881 [Mycobacterium ulcerans str. Harvey]|uniref:Uncharacterized protein n=1 Tax=Mycobacterium ulcerans str. Harvey TaxID=1299332 RepID=A0ABN0R9Q2_MYCUL|nr:hypothetical protein I551_8881 [Mycobacterium ulcerans str. Harvey]